MGIWGPNLEKMRADQDINGLIKALGHFTKGKAAIEVLVDIGKSAVEPLIAVLEKTNNKDSVRQRAASALGKLGDNRAVNPLIAALKDRNANVRQAAAQALGELEDPGAVDPLIKTLNRGGRYQYVRLAAIKALGKIGDARATEPLINKIQSNDGSVRDAAADALGKIGDARAVEPLIKNLKSNNWGTREAAARVLGEIGDARAVDPLLTSIRSTDPLVQFENDQGIMGTKSYTIKQNFLNVALGALSKIDDPCATNSLIAVFSNDKVSGVIIDAAARALVNIGEPGVEPLIASLTNNNANVRLAAAQILGELNDSRAVEPLVNLVNDNHRGVRKAANKALEKMGCEPA